jgi:hypothetical protein
MSTTPITAVHFEVLAEMLDGLRLSEPPAYEVAPAYEAPPAYCKASEYFTEPPPAYGDIDLPSDDFVREWVWEAPDVVARLDWFMPTIYLDEAGVSFDHLRWRRRWLEFARNNPDDHHNYLLRTCCGRVDLETTVRSQIGREFYPPGMQPQGRRPETALITSQDYEEYARQSAAFARHYHSATQQAVRAAQNALREQYRQRVRCNALAIE